MTILVNTKELLKDIKLHFLFSILGFKHLVLYTDKSNK